MCSVGLVRFIKRKRISVRFADSTFPNLSAKAGWTNVKWNLHISLGERNRPKRFRERLLNSWRFQLRQHRMGPNNDRFTTNR